MGLTRSHRLFIATSVAALTLVSLSGLASADATVTISATGFSPQTLTISAGDMVVWSNSDTQPHTATADLGSFDTGPIAAGQTASVTFLTPGTYSYTDQIAPSRTGTITVAAAAHPTPSRRSPPPTDIASDITRGDSGPGTGLLIGLTLLAAGALLSTVRLRAARRDGPRRWAVLLPGEAPRRGSSLHHGYRQADQWNRDDQNRG